MKFRIVTPERVVHEEDDVESITLPTRMGQITVLKNHLPLVSVLAPGELIVRKGGAEISMAVSGGLVEVIKGNEIVILADTAERVEEIDVERAEAARKKAHELMQEKVADAEQYAYLAAKIEKELARLRIAKKYRRLPQ